MRDRIKTERLELRQLVTSDAETFSRYCGDMDIAKMTGSLPHPFPVLSAEIKISLLNAQKRTGLARPYAITLNGEMIGIADIFRRNRQADWELGYWIGRPFWGKGYAVEAMQALMDEARKAFNITRFIASIWDDNPASGRVLEKLGFKLTGPNGRHFCMARLCKVQSLGYKRVEKPIALNHLRKISYDTVRAYDTVSA